MHTNQAIVCTLIKQEYAHSFPDIFSFPNKVCVADIKEINSEYQK